MKRKSNHHEHHKEPSKKGQGRQAKQDAVPICGQSEFSGSVIIGPPMVALDPPRPIHPSRKRKK